MLTKSPDALLLPSTLKRGNRLVDRVASIVELAEAILGVDRSSGERAWIRQQPHGQLFITRDLADTICFPRDHPLSGQPRYRWEKQSDGSEWGYLVASLQELGVRS
jgi:hypothetical protein